MVAVASRRVAETPATSELRRDRPLSTHDIGLVYLDGLDVVVKKMSPELPVQRPARERFVKACIKLGLPLNPRKRLVHAGVGSSVGWRVRWQGRSALPRTQEKCENPLQTTSLSSEPWAG